MIAWFLNITELISTKTNCVINVSYVIIMKSLLIVELRNSESTIIDTGYKSYKDKYIVSSLILFEVFLNCSLILVFMKFC